MNIHSVLRSHFKLDSFHSSINAMMSEKDTVFIMPMGCRNSLCYQLPALIFSGFTLIVAPLIPLIEDQMITVTNLGIESHLLKSTPS